MKRGKTKPPTGDKHTSVVDSKKRKYKEDCDSYSYTKSDKKKKSRKYRSDNESSSPTRRKRVKENKVSKSNR